MTTYIVFAVRVMAGPDETGTGAPGDAGTPRLEHLARALELTPDQTEALRNQIQAKREHLRSLHQARSQIRAELEKLFAAADADEQAVNRAGQRLAELNAEITLQQVQMRQAISRVLTPEQTAKWQQMRRNMQKRHNTQDRPRRPNRQPAEN